ncbi:MAG: hypothetical protein QG673_1173 [Pseudomonadota bacterium]|nr:hypothetical protein [Pseudomonadota bacterium]
MDKAIYVQLGELIKCKRRDKQISQEELAWRCKINKNSLGRIERAEGEFLVSTLFTIFNELNIDFKELNHISHLNYKPV